MSLALAQGTGGFRFHALVAEIVGAACCAAARGENLGVFHALDQKAMIFGRRISKKGHNLRDRIHYQKKKLDEGRLGRPLHSCENSFATRFCRHFDRPN